MGINAKPMGVLKNLCDKADKERLKNMAQERKHAKPSRKDAEDN